MADTTYKSIHKGAQIDSAVTEVLNNLAGIQGVKVDDTELTPDTENKVNIDTTAFNIPAVVQETGTSTTSVMSQNAVTTAINAIDIPEVVQQTGTSIETVMSQNAVTNAIGDIPQTPIVQVTGQSTTDVMSQKATTDSIINQNGTGDNKVKINSASPTSTTYNMTLIDSNGTNSVGSSSVIIGGKVTSNGTDTTVAVGAGCTSARYGVSIGASALCTAQNSTAVGANATIASDYSTAIGSSANISSSSYANSVAIGASSSVAASNATCIGKSSQVAGAYSVALGANSKTTEASTVSVGDGSTSTDYGTRRIVNVKDPVNAQDVTTKNYVDGKVEDSIVDGHTTIAPSGNAVYDALALKLDKTSTGTTRRVYGVDATDLQELTEVETTPTDSSTKLVTSGGIKTALDLKAPLASPAFTGIPTGIRQDFTATLPYASWTGSSAPYTKAVTVTGILATDKPDINLDLSSATYSDVATIQSDWANVYRGVTSADTITFYASEVPTIDIPLQIKVVR